MMAVTGSVTMVALATLASGRAGVLGAALFVFPIFVAGVLHLAYALSMIMATRAERPEQEPIRKRRLQPAT